MGTSTVGAEIKLREFITRFCGSIQANTAELTDDALYLLNTLPSSKDSILEYFCRVFHHSVDTYFLLREQHIEQTQNTENEYLIRSIYKIICAFINSNPKSWAPIILEWSLELLGQISVKNTSAHKYLSLTERLQLWMHCESTHTLMEINMQCLQHLIDSDTDSCVSVLLNKSIMHGPYFDWVVAYVGSCFPPTVINKIINDFCLNDQTSQTPYLHSVVGILEHFAGTHFNDASVKFVAIISRYHQYFKNYYFYLEHIQLVKTCFSISNT